MSSILMTAILFSLTGCAALLMRKRFEEQLPLALGFIVLVLYGFAVCGQLMAGAYAVLGSAAAALAVQGWLLLKNRRQKPWQYLLTPGCMAFFLCALWLLISFRGYMFTEWDDFSHWGLAVRNMDLYRAIPSSIPEANITYTDYPPATTLFSWFWTFLSGAFNEEDAQRALNMMMLCFLLPAMKDQQWKRPGKALCMAAALFVLPLVFAPRVYRALQVDALLGVMFFYALYAAFFHERKADTLPGIGCTLLLLPLVKEMGTAFAAAALAVIAADLLRFGDAPRKSAFKWIACLALAIAAGKLSWEAYLRFHQVGDVWNTNVITSGAVLDLLRGRGQVYQKDVLRVFPKALCDTEWWFAGNVIKPSFAMFALALVLAQCWLTDGCADGYEKKRFRQAFSILMAGLAAYAFALLVMYLFMFRDDEARKMISLDRYLSSYFIPAAGFTMMLAAAGRGIKQDKYLHRPLCILACMLLVVNPLNVVNETVLACDQNTAAYEMRMEELIPEHVSAQLDSGRDRVYVVSSGDNGYEYYLDAYQLTPVRIQEGMWTTWPVTEKIAIWTETPSIEYSPEEWGALLKDGGFTHVYLDTIDERFVSDYHSLFDSDQVIRDGELYRVELLEDGVMLTCAQ